MDIKPSKIEINEIFFRSRDGFTVHSNDMNGIGERAMNASSQGSPRISIGIQVIVRDIIHTSDMMEAVHACYRAAGDCGIISTWERETKSEEAMVPLEKTGADVRLIGRLMRLLGSMRNSC
ncbi:hypothetical protein EG328_002102 [Venturia inaequalis]|uniref:Uncharacterized protein n=1 Tax=Venturia inaequalis TaxID=5025 RepID=A0A8H3UX56_VENIN|nr:hypothetical protein EG328_002102 [Venturia inaequalis]KAE9994227.1 hypothetical protein EG327_000509 [Venturia inaequalis]